jgi:hypothetical protein
MTGFRGYRNTGIVIAFLAASVGVVWMTVGGDQSVAESATTIAAMAAGTGLGVFGRGYNKGQENGK